MTAAVNPTPEIIAALESEMIKQTIGFNKDRELYGALAKNPAVRDYLIQQGICAVWHRTRHLSSWGATTKPEPAADQAWDSHYQQLWFNLSVLPHTPVSKVTATVWCLPDEAQDDMLTYVQAQKYDKTLCSYSVSVIDGFDRPVLSTFSNPRTFSNAIWILPAVLEVTTKEGEQLVFNPGLHLAKLHRDLSLSPNGTPPLPMDRIINLRPTGPKIP